MITRLKRKLRHEKNKFLNRSEHKEVKRILGVNHTPIYHIHIRKTAGTTINFAFLSNSGDPNLEKFYEQLAQKENHRIIRNNKVFVGWNKSLINKGYFSYAFSHKPVHELKLPENTFLFTCLRDPAKRVISHYNMLKHYQINGIDHPSMKTEGKWIGNSFDDFMGNIPKEKLLNQLYMFSSKYDINEALNKLLSLDKILFTENLKSGLLDLETMTGWHLPVSNQKKYNFKSKITNEQTDRLKDLLMPEYILLEHLNNKPDV